MSRISKYGVNELILNRWSPRSLTGEEVPENDLMAMFEAAHWAPSSYNNQPWRFIYARHGTPEWDPIFNLMVDFNKGWAKNAGVLVVVISCENFEHNGKPARTHSFDSGAAWMSLALEARSRGYIAHGMEGFDYDKAREVLGIPDDYSVEAMIAIGKQAPKEALSPELQEKEQMSGRKSVEEVVMEGRFRK